MVVRHAETRETVVSDWAAVPTMVWDALQRLIANPPAAVEIRVAPRWQNDGLGLSVTIIRSEHVGGGERAGDVREGASSGMAASSPPPMPRPAPPLDAQRGNGSGLPHTTGEGLEAPSEAPEPIPETS